MPRGSDIRVIIKAKRLCDWRSGWSFYSFLCEEPLGVPILTQVVQEEKKKKG